MKLLQQLCSVPTAPFVEDRVIAFVKDFVKQRKKLKLSSDEHGNLLIELKNSPRQPRWVFTAHMDHPGFVAGKMLDGRTLQAQFRGWVMADFVAGAKVRFFDRDGETTGTVTDVTAEKGRLNKVTIRVKRAVEAGAPGMFDQGEGRVKSGKFHSRVCDDLAGAAAALEMIDQLAKQPPKAPVAVLLTRAEEEGFIGAIAASLKPKLLRKTDRLIVIECSAKQPYADQGNGAIIRIGDRTSVFNSSLSYFLTQQAERLAKRDKSFKYQRALMPGGTCEATVYDIYGFTAGSICIALGNYHNMDRDRKRIGPEYVDVNDWRNMVKLFLQVARSGHEYEPGHQALRRRVEERFEKVKKHLYASREPRREPQRPRRAQREEREGGGVREMG